MRNTFSLCYDQEEGVAMKIKITADSTCDLTPGQLQRYDIALMNLYVHLGERCLRDVAEVGAADVFEYVNSGAGMCSTSAASIGDYMDLFAPLAAENEAVVHISLGSDMSSSYQNAVLASREFDNVHVVDSRNVSVGHGMVALKAAQLAESGAAVESLLEEVRAYADKVELSFVLGRLDYLHKGGRCSAVAALGANLLKLKPCVDMREGKLEVGKKYRGGLAKCVESYAADRLTGREDLDLSMAIIVHSGADEESLEIARRAVEEAGFKESLTAPAGCTISCHCGPGSLGIVFARK